MGKNKKKIVVAMSGGVDSSVCAFLLKKAGFEVEGVFMKVFECKKLEDRAKAAAKKLGIELKIVDLKKEFKKKVIQKFLDDYKKGLTPNPCVVCNSEIKFGLLMEKALKLGADFFATGHYIKIKKVQISKSKYKKLFIAKDKNKDQSYFLWGLKQKQLKKIIFPQGNYAKEQIKKIAKQMKLPAAGEKESQEVCFIETSTGNFLKTHLKIKPGNIVDTDGKIIGKHDGLIFYTIGQRKGIGLGGGPYYVTDKNFKNNVLIVSKSERDLYKKELLVRNINWISGKIPMLPLKVQVKIRYRSLAKKAVICKIRDTKYKILFEAPQRAITPGQSAVFYRGQELLGGGIIC